MASKRYSSEQIISYLREADVLLAKDSTIGQVCQKIGRYGADLLPLATRL
jgi:hypothetical protein